MGSVLEVIQGVQDIVKAITGIRAAPYYAPDLASVLPMSVAYPQDGTFNHFTGGAYTALHNIVVEIHFPRSDLTTAIKASISYISSIPAALIADPTLGGKAQTFDSISYTYGAMSWGEGATVLQTFGVRFIISNVKLQT